ncbi:hypothetical protein [Spirosoma aerophilum]
MKKLVMAMLSIALLSTSCKKGNDVVNPDEGPGGYVPAQVAGKWMYGSFSMSEFWSYDGRYQGNPFELAVVFDFKSNGTYEKYFVASALDYSTCKTQAFTYEKGRVTFDEADRSFTTVSAEGSYRGFYSCVPSKNINRKMERSEMKTQTYYYTLGTGSNNKKNLVVRFDRNDTAVSTFLPTSW